MPTYAIHAHAPEALRSDGANTVVVTAADEAAAREDAEALLSAVPGALARFRAVELGGGVPPFAVQGHPPVGGRAQAVWPTLGRGGQRLRGD